MKRLLSGITVIALLVTTIAASSTISFAGTSESEGLQKAITTVKTAVTIPNDLSEFSYNKQEGADNKDVWYLNWSNKEGDGTISVSVEGTDTITSYYCYKNSFSSAGLAKVTKEQAQNVADDTLKKMLPKFASSMKLEQSETLSSYDSDYSFNYKMYVNNIPCDFIVVSISVNKYAGELSHFGYNCNTADLAIASYPSKDKIISKETAKAAYLKELGPKLKYFSNYDYTKKTLKVYPAYETAYSNKAVDAQTGKAIDLYSDYRIYAENAAASDTRMYKESSQNGIEYTEEELSEIEKTVGLLSKSEADKRAKELVSNMSSQTLASASLSKDNGPDQNYIWYLNYDGGSISLNAKTGILLNFYNYKDNPTSSKDIGLEKAKRIADDYMKKVCQDKLDQVTWSNQNAMAEPTYDYGFVYTRKVNDIEYNDNSIYVSVNKINGDILSYSRTWYECAKFPALNGVIDQNTAFNAADKYATFGLTYKKIAEDKVALVYDFLKGKNYILDAFTGERLSWEGDAYKTDADYTDIKGTWAENIILELKNNGYYLVGSQFAPRAKTTQIEFFRYLYSPEQEYYSTDEEFYDMLVAQKIIKKEEINASANITRQEAAKFIVRYLGYDNLASKPMIFKNMFKDKVDSSYLGYVSSAYGFGIMKGDAKGRFNGTNTLSHAEAAVVIYNTLKAR